MNNKKTLITTIAAIMAAILLLSLLLSLLAPAVSAASSSEIKDQIDQLKDESSKLETQIEDLESSLKENDMEIKSMVARKNGIDQQIALLHEQIENVSQTVSAYNLLIADQQEALDAAEEKYALLNEAYRERIRAMEEQGEISYWSVIFKANSFSDLLDRLNMILEIARADQKRLEQLRQAAEQVEIARQELTEEKLALEQTRQELEEAEEELFVKNSEAEGLLLSLLVKGDEYQFELDKSEQLQHELMEELAQKNEAYEEAKYLEWLATSVPPTTTTKPTTAPTKPTVASSMPTKTNTVNGITWVTPTENYRISSDYGWRTHPISGKWTFHYGIDMAAPKNTPIYATRAGVVTTTAYQEDGAGNYVWINHGDGYKSIYMHMTRYIVKKGQYVEAGQIIGYVGTTGGSTGNHLHFGISYKGGYVDPMDYIDA